MSEHSAHCSMLGRPIEASMWGILLLDFVAIICMSGNCGVMIDQKRQIGNMQKKSNDAFHLHDIHIGRNKDTDRVFQGLTITVS